MSVGMKLSQHSLVSSFRRHPRGGIEQEQLGNLKSLVQGVILVPMEDRWKWEPESLGDFSVASARTLIDAKTLLEVDSRTRWITYVPIKVNVHAWKVKIDALPTRFNVSRRGIGIDSIMCGICDNGDIPYEEVESYEGWFKWFSRLQLSSKNKKMLEGVFYVMWWHLWAFRNMKMFDATAPLKAVFYDEGIFNELRIDKGEDEWFLTHNDGERCAKAGENTFTIKMTEWSVIDND
nr:RNA-directed DNA polymerase, eukaryota [Tanacetum cinerariifolium]